MRRRADRLGMCKWKASAVSGNVRPVELLGRILGVMGIMRGRPWGPDDLTGGPVDDVFAQVRVVVPGLVVERLQVNHPADDDNV
jgi:hypothetical protein